MSTNTNTNTNVHANASTETNTSFNFDDYDAAVKSGNENIDRYIDESIRAQDEKQTTSSPKTTAQSDSSETIADTAKPLGDNTTPQIDGSNSKDTAPEQNRQEQNARTSSVLPDGYTEDSAGNIRKSDGSLVASAGEARRWWERYENVNKSNRHAQAYIKRLEGDITAANSNKDASNYLNGVPQQLGLQHNEVATGLNIIATWKKNPHEAIKYLLTEYAALGHNVNELLGREGGIDLNAVQTMINRAVQPLVGSHQQQQQQNEVEARVERQYNAFMAKYPEAAIHEDDIASLMARDKDLNPTAAFHMLKAWALEQRLDFTKPLGSQFSAVPTQSQSANNRNQPLEGRIQQNRSNVPPIPNARGTSEAALSEHQGAARADEDWDGIVRDVMRNSGYIA